MLLSSDWKTIISLGIPILFIIVIAIIILIKGNKNKEDEEELLNAKEFLVNEFIQFRKELLVNYDKKELDLNGAYVLFNLTKNMYYIGQSKDVVDRINMHFTGKGNGDVYADYKNGDVFIIKYILLGSTKCKNLNQLEKKLITAYQANYKGYNKTKGNE